MFWNNKSTPALQKLNKLWGFFRAQKLFISIRSDPKLAKFIEKSYIYSIYIYIITFKTITVCYSLETE